MDVTAAWMSPQRGDEGSTTPPLEEARESLAYWEGRSRSLPVHAVRRRREARMMAARWRARVAAGEREIYGRGVLGALALYGAEGRLPEPVRHGARQLADRTTKAAAVIAVAVAVTVLACVAAAIAVIVTIFSALF